MSEDPGQKLAQMQEQQAHWGEIHADQKTKCRQDLPGADVELMGIAYTAFMVMTAALDIAEQRPVRLGTVDWMLATHETTKRHMAEL